MITSGEIEAWATWMRAAGRPATTIGLRTYHVARVLREIETDPWSLTTQQLVDYLGAQEWKPETRRSYRASLRTFYTWAQATARRADNPAALLPTIKVPRALPRPTPEGIYYDALREADDRLRRAITLAAVYGLRIGEVVRVRREDVLPDLDGHSLSVLGKGGHVREVPLEPDMVRDLLAHPPGWIFPSSAISGGHLTSGHLGKLISQTMPRGWSAHPLRHRCATVAYHENKDIRAVQELLGHAKIETTVRYTKVPRSALRAAIRATSVPPSARAA